MNEGPDTLVVSEGVEEVIGVKFSESVVKRTGHPGYEEVE